MSKRFLKGMGLNVTAVASVLGAGYIAYNHYTTPLDRTQTMDIGALGDYMGRYKGTKPQMFLELASEEIRRLSTARPIDSLTALDKKVTTLQNDLAKNPSPEMYRPVLASLSSDLHTIAENDGRDSDWAINSAIGGLVLVAGGLSVGGSRLMRKPKQY